MICSYLVIHINDFTEFYNILICYIAQLKLLGDFEDDGPDLNELTVTTEIVPKDKIGEVKPQVIGILLIIQMSV